MFNAYLVSRTSKIPKIKIYNNLKEHKHTKSQTDYNTMKVYQVIQKTDIITLFTFYAFHIVYTDAF